MNTLKEHIIQAPPGMYYTSVPMNALRTILTNKLKYKMKKKKEFRLDKFIFQTSPRFILGQSSNYVV
ncbi:MAG: hypothetical protein WB053_05820 [Nitrososphaeraceae archaeon]